jgi:hypothetical protein
MRRRCDAFGRNFVQNSFKLDRVPSAALGFSPMILALGEDGFSSSRLEFFVPSGGWEELFLRTGVGDCVRSS